MLNWDKLKDRLARRSVIIRCPVHLSPFVGKFYVGACHLVVYYVIVADLVSKRSIA